VGAAIGTVSGQIDRIYQSTARSRDEILAEAKAEAIGEAVRAGADPRHVEIIDLEDMPIAYMTNPAIRIRIKAAGPLAGL
jgi:hypothetical protein